MSVVPLKLDAVDTQNFFWCSSFWNYKLLWTKENRTLGTFVDLLPNALIAEIFGIMSILTHKLEQYYWVFRSSHPEVFLREGALKICSKFTGEHPCRSVISIKLQSNFIEITFRHGCSPVNLLHIFRTPLPKNTSGWTLLSLAANAHET